MGYFSCTGRWREDKNQMVADFTWKGWVISASFPHIHIHPCSSWEEKSSTFQHIRTPTISLSDWLPALQHAPSLFILWLTEVCWLESSRKSNEIQSQGCSLKFLGKLLPNVCLFPPVVHCISHTWDKQVFFPYWPSQDFPKGFWILKFNRMKFSVCSSPESQCKA